MKYGICDGSGARPGKREYDRPRGSFVSVLDTRTLGHSDSGSTTSSTRQRVRRGGIRNVRRVGANSSWVSLKSCPRCAGWKTGGEKFGATHGAPQPSPPPRSAERSKAWAPGAFLPASRASRTSSRSRAGSLVGSRHVKSWHRYAVAPPAPLAPAAPARATASADGLAASQNASDPSSPRLTCTMARLDPVS